MVQLMITKEETARLQQCFETLDLNSDGKIQFDELLTGFDRYNTGDQKAKDVVERVFQLVDADHSNEIDFSEFVVATVNRQNLLQDKNLKQAFNYYDKDKGGTISIDELKQVLGIGQAISDKVWQQIVQEVDENGDGEVQFEEFKTMMQSLLK